MLRAGAVAALLALAAGVLYSAPRSAAVACPTQTVAPSAGPTTGTRVPAGMVGVTVPVADPSVLAIVRPGDRVDLHSNDSGPVIADVPVLATLPGADLGPPALYLAMTPDQASSILGSPVRTVFRVIVRS
jgi:hypothetical protein